MHIQHPYDTSPAESLFLWKANVFVSFSPLSKEKRKLCWAHHFGDVSPSAGSTNGFSSNEGGGWQAGCANRRITCWARKPSSQMQVKAVRTNPFARTARWHSDLRASPLAHQLNVRRSLHSQYRWPNFGVYVFAWTWDPHHIQTVAPPYEIERYKWSSTCTNASKGAWEEKPR